MDERHQRILRMYVARFGLPLDWGGHYIYVKADGINRREYPDGIRLHFEEELALLYEMEREKLIVSLHDDRRGFYFDGKYGSSPGWAPGDPADPVVIILSDEALAWIDTTLTPT